MSVRAFFRAVGWIASEFIPAQAVRAAFDRDFNHAVTKAAQAWDGADDLAEAEELVDVWEPFGRLESESVDAAEPLMSPVQSARTAGAAPGGVCPPTTPPGHSRLEEHAAKWSDLPTLGGASTMSLEELRDRIYTELVTHPAPFEAVNYLENTVGSVEYQALMASGVQAWPVDVAGIEIAAWKDAA